MPKLPRFNYVEDDELPNITLEFEGVDLGVFTSIVMNVRRPDGRLIVKTAVIDDAPNGLLHFEWAVGDLIEGLQTADIVFTESSGKSETFPDDQPLEINVRPKV